MDLIERLDAPGFTHYLKQFGNTICGRHPIGVFLNMVAEIRGGITNGHRMDLKFLKYAQSSQVSISCQSVKSVSIGSLESMSYQSVI